MAKHEAHNEGATTTDGRGEDGMHKDTEGKATAKPNESIPSSPGTTLGPSAD